MDVKNEEKVTSIQGEQYVTEVCNRVPPEWGLRKTVLQWGEVPPALTPVGQAGFHNGSYTQHSIKC